MLVIGPPAACLMGSDAGIAPCIPAAPKISALLYHIPRPATIAPAGRPHQISTNLLFHLAIPRKTRYTI